MTHDCDRAAECPCYQAGYLNGQQTGEWTLAALVDSFETTKPLSTHRKRKNHLGQSPYSRWTTGRRGPR